MKTKMFMSMLVIALAAALVGGATMAIFTDEAVNAGNTFTAGTVNVELGETPAFPVEIENMAPGDTYTGSFEVVNAGTLDLRFDVTYATVAPDDEGTPDLFGEGGAVVTLIENYTDVVLAPGDTALVEYTVELPIGAGNAFQGAEGSVNFTIDAEQTANNPVED